MPRPTRRHALVTLAASAAAPTAPAAERQPRTFSAARFELLTAIADRILPDSETPGAVQAGVPRMIDEDAADPAFRRQMDRALDLFAAADFLGQDEQDQIALLERCVADRGELRAAFQTLKDAVIDRYYATEIGLVDELGYQGNTYLAEFPGCQHEHGKESA